MRPVFPRALFSACGLALALAALPAAAQVPIKVVLNWKYEGPQSWFFLAQDKGYFKEEGLDVSIDQGEGSAASIPKVAAGAYQAGFGDINALVDLASKRPADAPVAVYMLYNTPPFTLVVKSDSAIRTPKDLEGKTVGGPANDGALKLFPAFAKIAKIDASKVNITNMAPNLREQMLTRGQIDAGFGYVTTVSFSAKGMGLDPAKDLRFIRYGDYGMDLYSNAVFFSKSFVKDNPKTAPVGDAMDKLILQKVKVLAVTPGADGGNATYILSVSTDDAETIQYLANAEKIWLTLARNDQGTLVPHGFQATNV